MTASRPAPIPKPHSFLTLLRPKGAEVDPQPPRLPFRLSFETPDYYGAVSYGEREMLTQSADGNSFVILSGALYRPQSADAGATILALYARRGADFVHDLNGQFALLLVDQRAGQIIFVTDRLNSIKLIVSEASGALAVSNSMDIHPIRARIDSAAVASILVAGFAYNNRTLIDGTRLLAGGSIYQPRGLALEQRRYWDYLPANPPDSPARAVELQHELEEAIVDATRVRLRGERPVYLSLTAGYDSRGVLGLLTERLRVPNIRAFTYAYGDVLPVTDEALAPQLASRAGVEHRLIPGFNGNVVTMLTHIAQWGAGIADICDELDAWRTLQQETSSGPRPLLFTGDVTLIGSDQRLASVADAVTVSRMPDFSAVRWIEPLIGRAQYRQWVDVTRAEINRMVKDYLPVSDYSILRDRLRYDGRDSGVFAPWREYYAGRVFEIASPMTDERVIDVFMKMPVSLRRGKKLYHQTLTTMFPELFALPRASTAGYATYWQAAFAQQAEDIRAWIDEQPSPLDDLIEPNVLLALLDSDLASHGRRYTSFRLRLRKAYRWLRNLTGSTPIFARPSLVRPIIPAHRVLSRALVLRAVLQSVETR